MEQTKLNMIEELEAEALREIRRRDAEQIRSKDFRRGYLATWDSSGERMLRHAVETMLKTDKNLLKDARKTLHSDDAYTRGIAAGMEIVLKAHIDLLSELVEKVEKQ